MDLKGKDGYKVECSFALTNEQIYSLMQCYQSCIGSCAVSLYLTLISESIEQRGFDLHQRICALMGIDIVAFEHARNACEEYNLLQTYANESDSKTTFIYVVKPALLVNDFVAHAVYGRRLFQVVNSKVIEATKSKHIQPIYDKSDYKNISKKFNSQKLQAWNSEDEVKFNKVKPIYTFNQSMDAHIRFDYATFLQESTNLSFPIEARTKEALQIIGELATVYGVASDRMRILVGHCINNSTNVLDIQKLKALVSYEKPKETKAKNPYDLSPVLFLQNIQEGIPVSKSDAKVLEDCVSKYRLKQEVVNVLIETVLRKNNNRLNTAFVEKIATSWVRSKIDTLEAALEASKEIGVKQSNYKVRKVELPKTFVDDSDVAKMSDEELNKLRERLKRNGG